jgi:hypothetical protein
VRKGKEGKVMGRKGKGRGGDEVNLSECGDLFLQLDDHLRLRSGDCCRCFCLLLRGLRGVFNSMERDASAQHMRTSTAALEALSRGALSP